MELQGTQHQDNLGENKVGGVTLTNFKTYYKVNLIKIVWHWHKGRQIDQQNRIERLKINHQIYGQLNFKEGKYIFNRKRILSSINDAKMAG